MFLFAVLAPATFASLRPFSMWGDGMVLQETETSGSNTKIWGLASPGAKVSLSGLPSASNISSVADADGAWSMFVKAGYGGPYDLILATGSDSIKAQAYFGDVFVCSGQSNLEFSMDRIDNYLHELAASNFPNIHVFSAADNNTFPANSSSPQSTIMQAFLPDPGKDHGGAGTPLANKWFPATNTSVEKFSALCFLTARRIAKDSAALGVKRHYGLIQSAKGGTPIQGWIPGDQAVERMATCGVDAHLPIFTQGGDANTIWSRPSTLYNQMLAPIAGYATRAIIWDQGEANMDEGFMLRRSQYACLFRQAILSWRQAWSDALLPVIFAQLHACGSQKNHCSNAQCMPGSWDTIRMAQADVFATTANTGMAVTYDQGAKGVHSPHKQPVAHRLALEVQRVVYANITTPQGPTVLGACLHSFDPATNISVVALRVTGAAEPVLSFKATEGCSDCCNSATITAAATAAATSAATTAGVAGVALGLFQLSKASSYAGEIFVDAVMSMTSPHHVGAESSLTEPNSNLKVQTVYVTASMGNMTAYLKPTNPVKLAIFAIRCVFGFTIPI